jgi:hypothetical protein
MPNWVSGRSLMLFQGVQSPTTGWMQQGAGEVRN